MASASSSKQPPKPPVVQPSAGNAIVINPCQRLNPILDQIRNVNKEFGDIVPDFQLGRTTCALYLSLKYHRLHPEYIHQRIQRLGHAYNLRILLLLCDISEHQDPIRELTKSCLINNITIMVAWTYEEAGFYLTTYKSFEHKPPDMIKERIDKDYNSLLRSALTSISKVNKMDVETLRTSFGSLAGIAKATPEQLQSLPGFGQVKVRRMKDAFEKPFRNNATSSITSMRQQAQTQDSGHAIEPRLQAKAALTANGRATPTGPFRSAADMPPASAHVRWREPSPPWDIELDLNDDDGPILHTTALGGVEKDNEIVPVRQGRSPSPVWDIELDLNDEE